MKRVVVVIWAIILGIVAGFIGAKLDQSDFNLKLSLITFLIFGLLLNFVPEIMRSTVPVEKKADK
ncbi:YjzD family protein [Lapidilactobacillus gannanensis]|uniref:YjzD family protein n=1 Tax=Lapidilactobacillus gannanensis TaxID=2486002 RepID=A0ABW4BMZ2_9LACO|nr:YjzD family protein [Lapidilactobacillus gannanensis]MCH4057406.1 YjzD family protein [Lactobacillaceae bacterium]